MTSRYSKNCSRRTSEPRVRPPAPYMNRPWLTWSIMETCSAVWMGSSSNRLSNPYLSCGRAEADTVSPGCLITGRWMDDPILIRLVRSAITAASIRTWGSMLACLEKWPPPSQR